MMVPIPLARLRRVADPLATSPWSCRPKVTAARVDHARVRPSLDPRAALPLPAEALSDGRLHAQRVAWLMDHGWADPIEIDTTLLDVGHWPITDGNHRLAAAILLGHTAVLATVSGFEDSVRRHLGRRVAATVFAG